jgi:hypothetical protein
MTKRALRQLTPRLLGDPPESHYSPNAPTTQAADVVTCYASKGDPSINGVPKTQYSPINSVTCDGTLHPFATPPLLRTGHP